MSSNIDSSPNLSSLDYNEYDFYKYMPDSEVVENELGYFLKNKTIETYSYIAPKEYGQRTFEEFLNFTFAFFGDGKEYFILKHPISEYYQMNSKILRQKRFIPSYQDVNVMIWEQKNERNLSPNPAIRIEKIPLEKANIWVDVFFSAFLYPKNLKQYITRMVDNQLIHSIDFYVGYVSEKPVSCFCTNQTGLLTGIYGVGTKKKFQRRGYAKAILSNFIQERILSDKNLLFCLQTQKKSGSESLYEQIGFTSANIQKRFDWNPSITLFS